MSLIIEQGTIEDVLKIIEHITEFTRAVTFEKFATRMSKTPSLVLVAKLDEDLAGFKAGYNRFNSHVFYSWLGAVKPEYRRRGIATKLASEQEQFAKENGFNEIMFKTRPRFESMQALGKKTGYTKAYSERDHINGEQIITFYKELEV